MLLLLHFAMWTATTSKGASPFSQSENFKDYRQMFGAISNEIDAVIVSTPDHTHAPVSLLAMENNKAVYCQKPLTHYVSESRELRQLAKQKGLITQMGIQVHSFYDYQLATLMIRKGAIGGKCVKLLPGQTKTGGMMAHYHKEKIPYPKP